MIANPLAHQLDPVTVNEQEMAESLMSPAGQPHQQHRVSFQGLPSDERRRRKLSSAAKERRRRRTAFIVVATFMFLLVTSILAVVITLTQNFSKPAEDNQQLSNPTSRAEGQ